MIKCARNNFYLFLTTSSQVYETRYNDLMETVKQSSNKSPTACSKCREHEKAIKKMQEEMANMKSEIEMVTAQKKMFEEDLEQEQLDAQQDKEKYKAQIESWKKNCVTLGKQVRIIDIVKEQYKKFCVMLYSYHQVRLSCMEDSTCMSCNQTNACPLLQRRG